MNETTPFPADPAPRKTTPGWLLWMPPRVRAFLFNSEPVLVFHSLATEEELVARLRAEFGSPLHAILVPKQGAYGFLFGSRFSVHWPTGVFKDGFAPVFHGRVESSVGGSVIRGRMSHALHTRAFLSVWCGAVVLVSLVSIWTIFMSLACYGMLWILNGMMAMGDHFHPGRREKILDFIRQVCGPEEPSK